MFRRFLFSLVGAALSSTFNPAQAINLNHSGDVLFVYGDTRSGDEIKLKEALSQQVKYVVLRHPMGNNWQIAKPLADVIADADVTTVAHGPCTSLSCSLMFLSGKRRQFSGVGRSETSYLGLSGVFYLYGSRGEQPSIAANDFWQFKTEIPYSLRQKYLQDPAHKSSALLFFHPAAQTSLGSSMACPKRMLESDCEPLQNLDAVKAGLITSTERFTHPALIENPDLATPPATMFARLEDPLPLPRATDECKAVYQKFLKADKPRAFVVSDRGGCQFAHAQNFRPIKGAMEACERTGAACRIYAVDDNVVFTPFL